MIADRSSRRLHRWSVGVLAMVLVSLLAPAGAARGQVTGPVPVPPDTGLSPRRAARSPPPTGTSWSRSGSPASGRSRPATWRRRSRTTRGSSEDRQDDRRAARRAGRARPATPPRSWASTLPDEPNTDQQGWLDEMKAARQRRRSTRSTSTGCGPRTARSSRRSRRSGPSTRNDTVRKLAQQANQFVMTHMTLLESSGIVDYGALPTAPPPAAAEAARCRWTARCSPRRRQRRRTGREHLSDPPRPRRGPGRRRGHHHAHLPNAVARDRYRPGQPTRSYRITPRPAPTARHVCDRERCHHAKVQVPARSSRPSGSPGGDGSSPR